MRKIPTLFERVYKNHRVVDVLQNVTEGMEWVLDGEGIATIKIDGACCAIINGKFYKRYDAKHGKPVPEGVIKCQEEADPVTGHLPCWVAVDESKPEDKWFIESYKQTLRNGKLDITTCGLGGTKVCKHKEYVYPKLQDGTYEAIGEHFRGNPYGIKGDCLIKHGETVVNVERTFEGIKKFLSENYIEGIVFWKDDIPQCKIKRSDFGFEWNGK